MRISKFGHGLVGAGFPPARTAHPPGRDARWCVSTFWTGGLLAALLCLPLPAGSDPPPPPAPPASSLETFLVEPIEIDNIGIWVPADRTGPVINRSCGTRKDCVYSCLLPADVRHAKTADCPDWLARLLAEYAARYHEESLPLTIFNGWQWEYSYSLCQFESVVYDLAPRGGSWENSLEAVLTRTRGAVAGTWLQIPAADPAPPEEKLRPEAGSQPALTGNSTFGSSSSVARRTCPDHSTIEVTTFTSIRTRDGYPKKRQL